MSGSHDQRGPTAPGTQTIVLERRERSGCLRKLFWPVLIVSVLGNLSLMGRNATGRLPNSLEERYVAGDPAATDKVAVVMIEGSIGDNSVPHMVRQVQQAREDANVKAVVLRVESPGGTVTGSDQIWREVELLKKSGKPVVVSMGGIAASGGYYVSAPADKIFAEPTTMTGSIGVIMDRPNVSELMEKVGVQMNSITAGEWKGMGSPYHPFTDRDKERFIQMIDETYGRFLRVVASGRKLTLEKARSIAEGKVFTAQEALTNGLIDQLGYLDDAIQDARSRAKLSGARVVRYQRPISFGDLFLDVQSRAESGLIDEQTLMDLQTPRMLMILR